MSSARIKNIYRFGSEAARDSYFAANPSELIDGLICMAEGKIQVYGNAEGWFCSILHKEKVLALPSNPQSNMLYYIP